ncbi:DoxX family protein [Pseudooceanicola sp.]|uniref:DoxX family protein n=1 Tax=Pseudooceanicola sp. TaxID=1914328 RepID=UPI00261B8776|nr:DoxX family protein [Pseudooceanicola sp.]MDF1853998.1 DoxX family protein [Pseudooceanicola sp.]
MRHFNQFAAALTRVEPLLATLARFVFAAVLLRYFWASGLTKLGDGLLGIFKPSLGAYAQIFPRQLEAVGYDTDQLGLFHWAVVVAGTWAEFLLPLAVVLGLFTRLAALGMIGFITVQSLTDLFGHGGLAHLETFGAWFDPAADSAILDQRALWIYLLIVLVIKGGGWLALDQAIFRNAPLVHPDARRPVP